MKDPALTPYPGPAPGPIDALLKEPEDEHPDQPDFALLSETLNRLFAWVIRGTNRARIRRHLTVGRRTLAMIWVLRPDLFGEAPSLARLAREGGTVRASLSRHASEFSRVFGIIRGGQSHGWNRRPRRHFPPPLESRLNGRAE